MGLLEPAEPHDSAILHPGEVILWNPVSSTTLADQDSEDEGEEDWLADAVREHAARLAAQIREWLDGGLMLQSKGRSEEHTSELQSLMRISYAVFCLKKNKGQ